MIVLYNLGIRVYFVLVLIASLFNKKAKLWLKGRRKLFRTLRASIDTNSRNAWFHASSLGEFEQGRPIMEALKTEFPDVKIVLTFFSPSGYEIRKNYTGADHICYLPLDTRRNARRFLKIVKPTWVFFIKYEFWYHFLSESKKSGCQLLLVSGIFRREQLFFKSYGTWYRKMLLQFTHLFVQNRESAELLNQIGIANHTVAGDSRFDRVVQIASQSKTIAEAEAFAKESLVMVCGSTWEPDEENLMKYLETAPDNFKLIIAPHEIHKAHIDSLKQKINLPYVLFSEASSGDLQQARVLIIDNIGILSSIYKYGQIAYIGGGFGAGIHNTLEAAVYGVPVLFGPKYQKFQEAKDLVAVQGGFSYSREEELKSLLDKLLNDTTFLSNSGMAAGNYVDSMKGATRIILNFLKKS